MKNKKQAKPEFSLTRMKRPKGIDYEIQSILYSIPA